MLKSNQRLRIGLANERGEASQSMRGTTIILRKQNKGEDSPQQERARRRQSRAAENFVQLKATLQQDQEHHRQQASLQLHILYVCADLMPRTIFMLGVFYKLVKFINYTYTVNS